MTMMLARHFKQPRVPYQEPCEGTGLVVDAPPKVGVDPQQWTCPQCCQEIVLTSVTPSMRRGGDWQVSR